MGTHYDAVIVGSGPNGLTAAVTLARAGLSVVVLEANEQPGGGARTAELTLPGFQHDLCSAVHPLAVASPVFRGLPLAEHGLEWIVPPVAAAHPLADKDCVLLHHDLAETARGLGTDAGAYQGLLGPLASRWEELFADVLAPVIQIPHHPLLLARFGALSLFPAARLARLFFRGERARALFAGIAAHANAPLEQPGTAAIGLLLSIAGHAHGWPLPRGGARSVTQSLLSLLRSLGGELRLGVRVRSLADLPEHKLALWDLTPRQLLDPFGPSLPLSARQSFSKYRYGPGVFKMDWALSGPIPWSAPQVGFSATVHLGGTLAEIQDSENAPGQGRISPRPYVLLCQPTLFDPSRAPSGKHIAWAYCHVPAGSRTDLTETVEAQVERYAPGFRDLILARATKDTAAMEASNANLIGGDINGGTLSLAQLLFRPRLQANPYRLPLPGHYLCSSSTPPGPGVHGMCGFHAAQRALQWLRKGERS